MINKKDSLKAGLRPLMAKTLENALSHRIAADYLTNGLFAINVMLKVKVPIELPVKLITVSSRSIATWDSSTVYDTVCGKDSIQ